MAIHVFRYKLQVDPTQVKKGIDPAIAGGLVVSAIAPNVFVDVTLDDSGKDDLDAIMAQLGYGFVVIDPAVTPPTGVVTRQIVETRLTVDASTTSTVFVDLLTLAITTEASFLDILATAATNAIAVAGAVRLMLDGVAIADGGSAHLVGIAAHAIAKKVPVAAGAHTVKLQWRTTAAAASLECKPVTDPDGEHATLIVRETTA